MYRLGAVTHGLLVWSFWYRSSNISVAYAYSPFATYKQQQQKNLKCGNCFQILFLVKKPLVKCAIKKK